MADFDAKQIDTFFPKQDAGRFAGCADLYYLLVAYGSRDSAMVWRPHFRLWLPEIAESW